jgi:ATP-binding cassette subfamily F protein 3
LNPGRTVLEEASAVSRSATELYVRTLLGAFLFREDDVFKKVKVLSGGEKSRLALVKILLDPPNFLLMDEPTTHLDISSTDALVEALRRYEGTLIFISHDVYFIKIIANRVVHIDQGKLRHFPGGYDYYLHKIQAQSERSSVTARLEGPDGQPAASVRKTRDQIKAQKRKEAEARQARAGERRTFEFQVARLEKEIEAFEKEKGELTVELENPATYAAEGRAREINMRISELQNQIAQRTHEWEKAAHRLEEIKAKPL